MFLSFFFSTVSCTLFLHQRMRKQFSKVSVHLQPVGSKKGDGRLRVEQQIAQVTLVFSGHGEWRLGALFSHSFDAK